MIGQTIARYRIVGQLGSGGMGVVYRAEDTHLGRAVALKFLPAELVNDAQALERFRREARVASSLSHPHICMVHDVGEHDGRQFIVMECLEGSTLRELLANGPLPSPRARELMTHVADALAAAHARGIVHRDVKPSNIFVTQRGDAKVMDFGLAKHIAPLRHTFDTTTAGRTSAGERQLTGPGRALGTIAYMSPEQARGEPLDARTDVFSLGVVMYEAVTGRRPFGGDTPALVFDGILNRQPEPAVALNPDVPAAFQQVIEHALEKDPGRRYQTAAELLADLRRVADGAPIAAAAGASTGTTEVAVPAVAGVDSPGRRPRRRLAAIAAALVLAVSAGLGWRALRPAAAPLTDRDSILLADFANATAEPVFDDTLRQALAVHLGQSPFLDIVGDERIDETLRLMNRRPGARLTHDVAREVCQRQQAKAMIEGSIAALGANYVIALTATACQDGDTLAREQVEAERKEDVLKAVGRAASRLRARLGESLSMLSAYDTPIEQATTPSLDALKAYTLGIKERARGTEIESIPFFQRAIELDPGFASALMQLSTVYGNLGESARATEYAVRAYASREHVSERERLTITHQYYDRVTGEIDKAADTLLLWERSYPRDYRPSNSLSVLYGRTGQYELAVEKALEALRRNPNHPFPYSNLAHAYRCLDRYDDARRVATQAADRGIETLPTRRLLYQLALLAGDASGAARHRDIARGRPREFDMLGAEAQFAAFEGRIEEARDLYRRAQDIARASSLVEVVGGYAIQMARMEFLLGLRAQAIALAQPQLTNSNVQARLGAATVLALAGETRGLQEIIDDAVREFPSDTLTIGVGVATARAALALQRGRPDQALLALQPAEAYELGRVAALLPTYLRGQAFLQQRNGPAAAVQFRTVLAHRGVDPFSTFYRLAPLALARALALAGDWDGSRKAYGEFLSGWSKADRDLAILAEARAERDRLDQRRGLAGTTRRSDVPTGDSR
jgi:tetratricopeptide (TPR) repeat protein